MCDFFSFLTTDKGDKLYLNYQQRKELNFTMVDSHSKIARVYYEQKKGCKVNAYEYNPITQELKKVGILFEEDYNKVLDWCKNLDFKDIVPELIIKPIVDPFNIEHDTITDIDIQRLKEWASVWTSIRDSILASIGTGVGTDVCDSILASVCDSILASVWTSIRDSILASIGADVLASVWVSVDNSIDAYISSFFNLDTWKGFEDVKGNPFQSCIDLWESGLVPSYDGKVWRLYSNKGIVYEMKESEE